jgi:hypothetical protein
MTNESVIDAFLDGEPVDPMALRDTLATGEGRDYLVDLLLLRRAVADMGPTAAVTPAPQRRSKWARLARLTVAAAVLLIVSGSAFWLGQRTVAAEPRDGRGGVEVVLDAPSVPRPTEVIRLVPGTSWHGPRENQP